MQLEVVTRKPESNPHPIPLLFVHGAWHGAWCWEEHFLPYFAQHGYVSYALDLRGHGKSEGTRQLRWMSIANYVSDVSQVVSQLERPPVLIAHSMGGLVVQKYLESHQVPAAVLMASVPPRGVLRTTLTIAIHHPLQFSKANLSLKLYPIVETPQLTREMLFSSTMPEEKVKAYFKYIQNESYRAFVDMIVSLPRPKRVKTPMLVLGGGRDAIFTPKEVEATGRAYSTQAEIFPNMAHDLMLDDGWEDVASRILGWIEERDL